MSNYTRITIEFTLYTEITERVIDTLDSLLIGYRDAPINRNTALRPYLQNGVHSQDGISFLTPGYFRAGVGYISSNNQQALEYLNGLNRTYTTAQRKERNIAGIDLDGNKVHINLNSLYPHESFQITGNIGDAYLNETPSVIITIQNVVSAAFSITNVFYQEAATNKCDFVRVRVNVVNVVYPVTINYNLYGVSQQKLAATSADLFVDIPRQHTSQNIITFISNDSQQQALTAQYVRRYQIASVDVISAAGISTATINASLIPGSQGRDVTPLMYSIDDVNYQSSNVFAGLSDGGYTAYIVDSLGCKKSMVFAVQSGIQEIKPEPHFNISTTNPLRFVDQMHSDEFDTIENKLSRDIAIPNVQNQVFRQPFNLGDVVRTQILSNYETIVAKVFNCDDELVQQITPDLRINNFGLVDKRDAFIKNGGEGKAHVYFFEGNVYDPETGDIINTYFTPGRLPSWAQPGILLYIQSSYPGYYIVQDIAYDNEVNSWAMAIDLVVSAGTPISDIITSKYNLEPWNVYEFNFTENSGEYYAIVEATDSATNYPDVLWRSEPIVFGDFKHNTIAVDYSDNESNAGIIYETGIQFRLNVPGRFDKYQPDRESDEFRDDMGVLRRQKTTYNRSYELETAFIPWWMAEKLIIASGHSNMKIKGIQVVNSDDINISDKIDENNPFYIINSVYQKEININLGDKVGIISGQRGVLGINEQTVIGT